MRMETSKEEMTWSERVAVELLRVVDGDSRLAPSLISIERVSSTTPSVVEVVYGVRERTLLRGIRFSEDHAREGPDLFSDRTPEELGWYLAHTGVLELLEDHLFRDPDENGVSWIRTEVWMRDVAGG